MKNYILRLFGYPNLIPDQVTNMYEIYINISGLSAVWMKCSVDDDYLTLSKHQFDGVEWWYSGQISWFYANFLWNTTHIDLLTLFGVDIFLMQTLSSSLSDLFAHARVGRNPARPATPADRPAGRPAGHRPARSPARPATRASLHVDGSRAARGLWRARVYALGNAIWRLKIISYVYSSDSEVAMTTFLLMFLMKTLSGLDLLKSCNITNAWISSLQLSRLYGDESVETPWHGGELKW